MSDLIQVQAVKLHMRGHMVAGVDGTRTYRVDESTGQLHLMKSPTVVAEAPGCHPDDAAELVQFPEFSGAIKKRPLPPAPPPKQEKAAKKPAPEPSVAAPEEAATPEPVKADAGASEAAEAPDLSSDADGASASPAKPKEKPKRSLRSRMRGKPADDKG